jgi:DNA-binding beta-propeller fold protein YncE
MACDAAGNLYVAKETGRIDSIDVYSASGRTLVRTVTDKLQVPTSIAVDKTGTMYVGNEQGGELQAGFVGVYLPGATTQARTLAGIFRPRALAVDAQDDVYVLDDVENRVGVYKPGSSTRFRIISAYMQAPTKMALSESTDTLYVGNETARVYPTAILAYDLTTGELRNQLHHTAVLGMSADPAGRLYAVQMPESSTQSFGGLYEYSSSFGNSARIRNGVDQVTSVATSL